MTNVTHSDLALRSIAIYEGLRRIGFTPDEIFFEITGNGRAMHASKPLAAFAIVRAQGKQFNITLEQHLNEADGKAIMADWAKVTEAYNAGIFPFDDIDRFNAMIQTTLNDMGGVISLLRTLMDKGFEIKGVSSEMIATGKRTEIKFS